MVKTVIPFFRVCGKFWVKRYMYIAAAGLKITFKDVFEKYLISQH